MRPVRVLTDCDWIDGYCSGTYKTCSASDYNNGFCAFGCTKSPTYSSCSVIDYASTCENTNGCVASCYEPGFSDVDKDSDADACECAGGVLQTGCYFDADDDDFLRDGVAHTMCAAVAGSDVRFGDYICGYTGSTSPPYDCNDSNRLVYPGAVEVCDGVRNDCSDGVVDDVCDVDGDMYYNYTIDPSDCVGSFRTTLANGSVYVVPCDDYGGDCNDSNRLVYPGAVEVCDYKDNDCNGYIDDNHTGTCYVSPACNGSVSCSSVTDDTTCSAIGCGFSPGTCADGSLCDPAHLDGDGNMCSDESTCTGYSCNGSVSCSQFTTESACNDFSLSCTWDDGCGNAIALDKTYGDLGGVVCNDNASCSWTCDSIAVEICSDGIDNDGDHDPLGPPGNGIDCMDSDCQKGSWSVAEVDSYNCLGTYQTGDVTGLSNYCAYDEDLDPNVGLCCPNGQKLDYDGGIWTCIGSEACLAPQGDCTEKYGIDPFVDWMSNNYCVNPSAQTACCNVVVFGSQMYYSDTDNVKVY